jgi:L-alanine-DL-glutamate epimerase-like enolase superfamily enzyme
MPLTRRDWLKLTGSTSLAASLPASAHASGAEATPAAGAPALVREAERRMFNLPTQFSSPIKIASVEMLKNGSNLFVRTRSTDGAEGITGTKQVEDFLPIFEHVVAPRFIGKEARDLEALIDEVYRANYKLASIPFWCCVAYIEQSLLGLLGKIAAKPDGAP